MPYGICHLSIVPIRREPDDRSEMISQILFGETFRVLQERKKWIFIRCSHDKYEGWIDRKQYTVLNDLDFKELKDLPSVLSTELVDVVVDRDQQHMQPIVLGSQLPFFCEGEFKFEDRIFSFQGSTTQPTPTKELLVENAFMYHNAPYLWGGRTPFGIDCSGFTQMVYKLNGVELPRDAKDQANVGEVLSFLEETEPGDLAFFDNEEGIITHVGLLLGENKIIHASGKVRVDRIDQQGIFNNEVGTHTHKLRLIKKVI